MKTLSLRNTHPAYKFMLAILLILALACVTDGETVDNEQQNDQQVNVDENDNDSNDSNDDNDPNDDEVTVSTECISASQTDESCNDAQDCPDLICNCEDEDLSMGQGCGGPDGDFCMDPEETCPWSCDDNGGWDGECTVEE